MTINESSSSVTKKRRKISSALRATGVTLLLLVLAYAVIYAASLTAPMAYGVVPFVVAFWLSVVWLAAVSYSRFMGVVAFVGILVPPVVLLVMLLAYSRAKKFLTETESIAQEGMELRSSMRREPTL
jgi:cell division protein FtsW (lipid II flippase)